MFQLSTLLPGPHLPTKMLRLLQNYRLRRAISQAYRDVSYYQKLFNSNKIRPEDIRTIDDLPRIPITRKEGLVGLDPIQRTARGTNLEGCIMRMTSGSSGTPFRIWLSDDDFRLRIMAQLRTMQWHGFRFTDKMLVIKEMRGLSAKKHWFQRAGILDREYIDLFEKREKILQRIYNNHFDILLGYTSELSVLASEILKQRKKALRPKLLYTAAELLDAKRREIIREAFGIDPIDLYGTTETGPIAWQCAKRSGYHINADLMAVEVTRDNQPCPIGEEGELVVTHFFSKITPVIRYSLGDVATISDKHCSCGCNFPMLKGIAGRLVDCILLPSGKRLSPYTLTCSIEDIHGLRSYQITQTSRHEIIINYVSSTSIATEVSSQIISRLENLLGKGVSVKTNRVEEISKKKGKFKVVKSLIA